MGRLHEVAEPHHSRDVKADIRMRGLSTKLFSKGDIWVWGEQGHFLIMVPRSREHVADEIMRKL